jgi:hypothetical protein
MGRGGMSSLDEDFFSPNLLPIGTLGSSRLLLLLLLELFLRWSSVVGIGRNFLLSECIDDGIERRWGFGASEVGAERQIKGNLHNTVLGTLLYCLHVHVPLH